MIYALCFIQEYAGGLSMRQQQRILHRAADKLGWWITQEVIVEASAAQKSFALRPGVPEMLQDAAVHDFDVVLVVDKDHLACSRTELEGMLAALLQNNIHTFGARNGQWIEPGGRHWMWLPGFELPEDEDEFL